MNKKLKIGNYIRTPKGIGKITNIYTGHNKQEDSGFCIDSCKEKFYCGRSAMKELKSSHRIMDLIEVGDYVNGSKIIELATNIDGKILYLVTDITEFDNVYACGNINIYEKDIKSIVTHEMFESMKYKLGE